MTLSTIKPAAGHRSTKTRILDAAEELFAARGYHGVSLRDITHAAGVEVALANYHFGPKEELFRQVVTRRSAAHCEGVLVSSTAFRRLRASAVGWPRSRMWSALSACSPGRRPCMAAPAGSTISSSSRALLCPRFTSPCSRR